jgi:hypothetical protein
VAGEGDVALFGIPGSPLVVDVRSALGIALFEHLAAVSPAIVTVAGALDAAHAACGGATAGEDDALAALVGAIAQQLVRPFVEPPPCVSVVSPRPRATPFVLHHAAAALRDGKPHATLVTATHLNMTLKSLDLSVIAELDGARDLDAIAERVGGKLAAGLVVLPPELTPLRSAPAAAIRRLVEQLLAGHAALGLLVG